MIVRAVAVLLLLLTASVLHAAQTPTITVYAASDLAFALKDVAAQFEKITGTKVVLVFGSTGNLAKQIEHVAPADVFFAANENFVDSLVARGAAIRETRVMYAQGRIVLAVPKGGGRVPQLQALREPTFKRIGIANPAHAPYGMAAAEALRAVGIWDDVRPRLVYGENIRQTLQYLQAGAVDAAIIALSVAAVPEIEWAPIDSALHRPLNQAAAVVRRSARPELALGFLEFVNGVQGRPIMKRYGFLLPGEF